MKYIMVFIPLMMLLLFIGCSAPEGNVKYAETFEKMTMKEKILYGKCSDVWGYEKGTGQTDYLGYVREAIRQRKVKPLELAMEFIDIKDIIISTNDTILIPTSTTDSIKKTYEAARFVNLNTEWYARLIGANQTYNGGDQSRGEEVFKFSNDLLLDCERKRGGSKVILYIGRKLYYVAIEDEWGDYKAIPCGGDK